MTTTTFKAGGVLTPPRSILRPEPLPDDVFVIRGGESSLDDAVLERSVGDCWVAHGFFGLSVFADPANTDIGALARRTPLVRCRVIRTTLAGRLHHAGFEVMPTFANPYHFSIVMPGRHRAKLRAGATVLRPADAESRLRPGEAVKALKPLRVR